MDKGEYKAFAGDPDKVMIFGQSGGGGKVMTMLQSPRRQGFSTGMPAERRNEAG